MIKETDFANLTQKFKKGNDLQQNQCNWKTLKVSFVLLAEYGFFATFPTSAEAVTSFVNGSIGDKINLRNAATPTRRRRSFADFEAYGSDEFHDDHFYHLGRR